MRELFLAKRILSPLKIFLFSLCKKAKQTQKKKTHRKEKKRNSKITQYAT